MALEGLRSIRPEATSAVVEDWIEDADDEGRALTDSQENMVREAR